MAIDMAVQTDEPIASRGFGGLYLCIPVCGWLAPGEAIALLSLFPVTLHLTIALVTGYK